MTAIFVHNHELNQCTKSKWFRTIILEIRGVSEKKQDLGHKKFISNPNYKLQVFPFEIIPLNSNTLSHPSPPRLHALLAGFSRDSLQLSSRPSWWLPRPENGSPWRLPWALGKGKNHTEPGRVSREVAPAWQCSSRPRTAGCSGRCELVRCHGEAATSCPATTLASFWALNKANTAGSLCRHADWSSGPVAKTPCGRCPSHRRTRSTWVWLWTAIVLLSSASATPDSSTEGSGSWSSGRTRRLMTLPSKSGSVSRRSRMSWHTCMRRFFWSLFSIFGTIFAQIFRIPKSSVIIFQTLSRFMPSSLAIVEQSADNRYAPPASRAQRWPQSCSLKAFSCLGCLPHRCVPLWISGATRKPVNATSFHLRTLAAVVWVLLTEFSLAGPETSGWFVALCPSLEGLKLRSC